MGAWFLGFVLLRRSWGLTRDLWAKTRKKVQRQKRHQVFGNDNEARAMALRKREGRPRFGQAAAVGIEER